MSGLWTRRPEQGEVPDSFADYVRLVPDRSVLDLLREQAETVRERFGGFGEEQGDFRYAPGKWSVKELLGHLVDTERIFAYRALRFARGDVHPLAGFDPDAYVAEGRFDDRSLEDLLDEHATVRAASISLFSSLPENRALATGEAEGRQLSVRSIAYVIAGHEIHHLRVLVGQYVVFRRLHLDRRNSPLEGGSGEPDHS